MSYARYMLVIVCLIGSSAFAEIRVGIIGLDTSHATAFTKLMNDSKAEGALAACRVVAAYPPGSPDIESSVRRVPVHEALRASGVEIVDSIPRLLTKVDAVLLETNDGRPHLEQLLPVLRAKKRVFIDKPIAGTLADGIAIFVRQKSMVYRCFRHHPYVTGKIVRRYVPER